MRVNWRFLYVRLQSVSWSRVGLASLCQTRTRKSTLSAWWSGRIERGVAQQTESLVRGFYEVWCHLSLWILMTHDLTLCDLRPCDCAGGGRPTRLRVWCPRAGAGHCWDSGDRPSRLEKQYRIQRRVFYWNRFWCCFTPGYYNVYITAGYHNVTLSLSLKVTMITT